MGPAIIMVGIAIQIPYSSVNPIFPLNCITRATGEGWGGKKPWVTDSAVSIGKPMYTAGKLYLYTTEKIRGTINTKPIP